MRGGADTYLYIRGMDSASILRVAGDGEDRPFLVKPEAVPVGTGIYNDRRSATRFRLRIIHFQTSYGPYARYRALAGEGMVGIAEA